jgi:Pentapeptide repeats (8 copies)
MLEMLLAAAMSGLFVAILGAAVTLHTKRLVLWSMKTQLQQLQTEWHAWKAQDTPCLQKLTQQQDQVTAQVNLEKDIARRPHVEDVPLPGRRTGQRQSPAASWPPPSFSRANLDGRDLSHCSLRGVDLRETQLVGTNFFMADLAGADLTGANLTGANLAGADLRNATLTDTNLLGADLLHAILLGANLLGARNLTAQQLCAAIYDSTTSLDAALDITLPRLPSVCRRRLGGPVPTSPAPPIRKDEATPPSTAAVALGEPAVSIEGSAEPAAQLTEAARVSHASLPMASAPVLPTAANDNQVHPKAPVFPAERQDKNPPEEPVSATATLRCRGKRRAKAKYLNFVQSNGRLL